MTAASFRIARLARVALVAAATMVVGATNADESPDPRIRAVEYRPTLVLPLTVFVGYHVHLEFAADEYFVNLGAGDTSILDVGAEANHLLLKPKQPTAGTNLTILTNRRTYFIDYRALGRSPRSDEAVYSIVFRYSDAGPPANATTKGPATADSVLEAPRPPRNTNYWYCGSPALRPVSASDDGLQLRLTFAPHAAFPAVYAQEADGEEKLVNTHVENDAVVVHQLADRLVVRRGREVGCIVDRSGRGRARRAETGTIDAAVDRATREVPR